MQKEQQELIERVAKYVCEQNGISPHSVYEVPGEEGPEYVEQWTRFVDDASAALNYLFLQLPVSEIATYTRIWKVNEEESLIEDAKQMKRDEADDGANTYQHGGSEAGRDEE